MNTSLYSLSMSILVLGIVLMSGCNVSDAEQETKEERECPFDNPMLPSVKNCYFFRDKNPSWSPDGQYIAFITSDQERGVFMGLYIYDFPNQTKNLIVQEADNMEFAGLESGRSVADLQHGKTNLQNKS